MKKLYILMLAMLCLTVATCKKDVEPYVFNADIKVTDIKTNMAVIEAINEEEGFDRLEAVVLCSADEKVKEPKQYKMTYEDEAFKANVDGLLQDTKYYYKIIFTGKYNSVETEVSSFETEKIVLPIVTTAEATEVTTTRATCGGNVTSDGGGTITARGVCWSTNQNPTIEDNKTTNGSGIGSYTSNLSNLASQTTYYVRSYATNEAGTAYGEEKSFTTLEILKPTVTTNNVTSITENTATCGGNVSSDGGGTITARGVCWSISKMPTIDNNKTNDGSGTGVFTSNLSNLASQTTYYVRAYATNEAGTAYGEEKIFTTQKKAVSLPDVLKTTVSNVTSTTAVFGSGVFSDGGGTVSARGFCWSCTTETPTIANSSYTTNGSGLGSFSANITGLQANKAYIVRAYATNEAGTAYGENVAFYTSMEEQPEEPIILPTVTTAEVTNITSNSATCGGNVTSDGNATVTSRGVCWSTSPNPTIDDNKTTDGSGTGSYTSNLSNLSENTTYYVRAYATNEKGTSYGEQKSFTTRKVFEETVDTDGNSIMTLNGNVIFKMIAVEGGTFKMGAQSSDSGGDNYDSDAEDDESPVHDVTLSSYYIGETEVTQELWEAVMGSNPSIFSGYPQRPVEQISWNDCQEFITELNNLTGKNFRLPTEAEWEYAARGGNKSQGYKFSGSNTIGNVAWYYDNSSSTTHDVKTKQANELGIYDMCGNVWEWCQDWHGSYSSGSQTNPTGPASGSYRVCRGGGWNYDARRCRVSNRDGYYPDNTCSHLGLRLSLSQY